MSTKRIERIIPIPQDPRLAQRIVDAVPDAWSDVCGTLNACEVDIAAGRAVRDTGYLYPRFGRNIEILRRPVPNKTVPRPDYLALIGQHKWPGFITFDDTGYGDPEKFVVAKKLTSLFVGRGYTGRIRFSNGAGREHEHEHPAQLWLNLDPWDRLDTSGSRMMRVGMPPALVLEWDTEYGGREEDVSDFVKLCSELPTA